MRTRLLLAAIGSDSDDHMASLVARRLRDAGYDVILLGAQPTPETVARAAVDEDVTVVALALAAGEGPVPVADVERALRDAGAMAAIASGASADELTEMVESVAAPLPRS